MNTSVGEPVTEESGADEEDSASEEEESDTEESPELETSAAASKVPARPTVGFTRFIMIFLGLMAVYAFIDPNVGIGFASEGVNGASGPAQSMCSSSPPTVGINLAVNR